VSSASAYLTALSVQLDEPTLLALCSLLSCPSLGDFPRSGFVDGWKNLSTSSSIPNVQALTDYSTLPAQRAHCASLRRQLATSPAFTKQVYKSSFPIAKTDPAQKSVPMDSALEFWTLFFSPQSKYPTAYTWHSDATPWCELWIEFYSTKVKRPVTRDLWMMIAELVAKTLQDGEMGWWREDGAWPGSVDEFVEYVRAWRKEKAGGGDEEMKADGEGEEMDES
jgi:DCN1-like protein 1/2